jgi:LmbE family N-acetylglucosaminyl deacetylase
MTMARHHHAAWRQLPIGSLDDIIGSGTCLVLAPHPDDESLGCGGLIASAVAAGRPPLVVILTDGTGSHPNSLRYPPPRLKALRAAEACSAVAYLGLPATRLVFLDLPDTAAPHSGCSFDAVVARLQTLVNAEAHCTRIVAPWIGDPHCDHQAAAKIAASTGMDHVAYPVWGWTMADEAPVAAPVAKGYRLDIAAHLPAKRQAIKAHRSQYGGLIRDDPDGFTLPPGLLTVFDQSAETFLLP